MTRRQFVLDCADLKADEDYEARRIWGRFGGAAHGWKIEDIRQEIRVLRRRIEGPPKKRPKPPPIQTIPAEIKPKQYGHRSSGPFFVPLPARDRDNPIVEARLAAAENAQNLTEDAETGIIAKGGKVTARTFVQRNSLDGRTDQQVAMIDLSSEVDRLFRLAKSQNLKFERNTLYSTLSGLRSVSRRRLATAGYAADFGRRA